MVDEMKRVLVALMNERISALNQLNVVVAFVQRGDVGVVLPQFRARGAYICSELPRVTEMQVPYCGS